MNTANNWIYRATHEMRGKANVIVFSKHDFVSSVGDIIKKFPFSTAFISIECTEECSKYWMEEERDISDNEHFLESSYNILNIDFDDLDDDKEYQTKNGNKVKFRTINEKQADEIVDFIESNMGKDIFIHCRAGSSRSQAVYRFIMDMYPEVYGECIENRDNPCMSPNMKVVSELKRSYYRKHGSMFNF